MISWLYKWLPVIFGCHCRADRSYFWHGKQFPICARCTGELVGIFCGMIVSFWYLPPVWAAVLLMLPMIADGVIQLATAYESTNTRRFVTGFLFGYSLTALFVISTIAALRFGYRLGQEWK